MKILIIGGTQFVGRYITQAALDAGHSVTLFNRGKTSPTLFPDVEKLTGDRNQPADLAILGGRHWDAVIDVNAYFPRQVRELLAVVTNSIDHYTLISTISVYAELEAGNVDENSPLKRLDDETTEEITGETYGGLKVLCERAAQAALPGRCLIIRPGLIVGAHDHTNRFRYWITRAAAGGMMLAPDSPDYPMQVIDGHDLAQFTLKLTVERDTGIYNTTSHPYRLGDILEISKRVSGSNAEFVWVDEPFLLEQGIQPYTSLPFWLPGDGRRVHSVNIDRALAAGLDFSPLEDTIATALEWEHTRGDVESAHGLTREREAAILEAWKRR